MKVISGVFNGTGAAVYLCFGAIPDYVLIRSVGDSELAQAFWAKNHRVAASVAGFLLHGGNQAVGLYTAGAGIEPYEGGDTLTSATQTSTAYGEGVYLGWDLQNYARNATYGHDGSPIDTWTLDTSANRTGHFNEDAKTGSRIGAGSLIRIQETLSQKIKQAVIEVLTAGQGESADEVTLSRAVASGTVLHISGKYDLAPLAVGSVTPAGIKLSATTDVNVNDEMQMFEAGFYDN